MQTRSSCSEAPAGSTGEEGSTRRKKIGIAELAVATNGEMLTTSGVGSCLGVAIYDEDQSIGGLVHVMLPEAEGEVENAAKYADTGIEALVSELVEIGAEPSNLVAKASGGSDMLSFESQGPTIGARNIEAVRSILSGLNIPLVAEDVGGNHGRSLKFHPSTGTLDINSAKRDNYSL